MNLVQSTFTTRYSLNDHIFVHVDDHNHGNAVSVICTNAVSASDSFSRFLVLCKFVCMHVYLSASWRPAVHICDQPTRACCLFRAHGQPTATGVFAVSGPVAWNSLPVALRSSDVTEETFRRQLKTFLFVLTISYVDSYRDIYSYVTILPSLPT